ncbi:leucine-rich repeat domain-containing protein [Treponema denticola]|nr:leucine-rich repeat domain-containing protein [Treponema denticola]
MSFDALPPGKASYTVKHYREKPEGGYPAEPAEREILQGTVGADAAYTAKTYEGFTYNSSLTKINGTVQTSGMISAGSTTAVELYYERKTVNVTFKLAGGTVDGNTDNVVKTGKYGTALTAPAPVKTGAVFKGWEPALPLSPLFPAADTEYTAKWQNIYTINFSVEGAGGTLKAKVDGNEITTGDSVEQGKSVVFTAEPAPDYVVEQWTKGGIVIAEAGMDTSYTYAVTANADIKVKFQSLFVEGGASLILSPDKLDIKVRVRTADGTPVTVEGCEETTLASSSNSTYTVLHAKGRRVILKGNITKLYCDNNQLTALDVQGLTALQHLNCGGNSLTALNVQDCTALKELYCFHNQLTALNVQGLTALRELDCSKNQLTELNVQGLSTLQELKCHYNQLTALNVQGLTALQDLYCWDNQLAELNVQGLTFLTWLYCGGNRLTSLDVQGLTDLNALGCHNNQLTALNVQGCTALLWLWCGGNQLTELNVQGCTALQRLECYSNQLNADAFKKLFDDLPQITSSHAEFCLLYTEVTGVSEGNHTDFTAPPDLAAAFNNAKTVKKWKMYKFDGIGLKVEL